MGYVKTSDEVLEIQSYYGDAQYTFEGLTVDFETTKEFARSVLPPCLEPADKPAGSASVLTVQGRKGGFGDANVSINARYGDIEGTYTLTFLIDTDWAVTLGREIWGEVKKHANIFLYRNGDSRFGYGERKGIRVIEIAADLGKEEGPSEATGYEFEIKTTPSALGKGLEGDPLLVVLQASRKYAYIATGPGTLTLRGSLWDPVDTIPVDGVAPVRYFTGESMFTTVSVETLPDRDAYVPFIYGRQYDDPRLFRSQLPGASAESSPEAGLKIVPVERTFAAK
jgi:hypothetical protein